MDSRKAHWERIYAERAPEEVTWYQHEPTLSLSLIQQTGLGKEAWVLDVGGGTSMLVDRLVHAGYEHLAVLDLAENALAHARRRFGKKARQVEWYQADVTTFEAPHPFSLWHDRAVFHFLTEAEDRRRYVEVLKKTLQAGGHLILATFAVGGPIRCSGLDIVQYDAEKLGRELGPSFRLVAEEDEMHVTPWLTEQAFTYFYYVKD